MMMSVMITLLMIIMMMLIIIVMMMMKKWIILVMIIIVRMITNELAIKIGTQSRTRSRYAGEPMLLLLLLLCQGHVQIARKSIDRMIRGRLVSGKGSCIGK